ncbi:MAG: PKD domain-containing protein [Deferribacteres bacterium]|nr:PKD domain-containing protein [Deferribacteres bacterium]
MHFGLKDNTQVDRLTIQWPSGIKQEIYNIPANQVFRAVEHDLTVSPASGSPPLTVNFTSNSSEFYNYEWDFDNDGVIDSTDPNPSYTYDSPGNYAVKLTVTDSDGTVRRDITATYIEVNTPPSVPQLIYPADGLTGLGTTVEFVWKESIDPDGDPVSYKLQICKGSDFATGCVDTGNALLARGSENNVFYAGTGAGLMIFGIVMAGSAGSRRKMAVLLIAMLTVAVLSVSCGSGGSGGGTSSPEIVTQQGDEVSQTVSGLRTGTTYYWKVIAYDGNGGKTESKVRSFTTE